MKFVVKKSFITISVLLLVGVAAVIVWQVRQDHARAARLEAETLKGLSSEELGLVLKSEASVNRPSIELMRDDPAKRRAFLDGLREYLALAAEARRSGFTEDQNFRLNVAYKKRLLLADLYTARLSQGKTRTYIVPEQEIEAVWAIPENEELFARDVRVLREIQSSAAELLGRGTNEPGELAGDKLTRARLNWARSKILSERARGDAEFINRPEVGLRLQIVEAGILATDFLRANWNENIRATDQEMAEYLRSHPEYDIGRKKARAEEILKRARQGEDFAALATEYSEDRVTREKGGLYADVGPDFLWKEVEEAALRLENGEVAPTLIESRSGFHIVKLENKKIQRNPDGSETYTYSLRHILLQNKFEEPGSANPGIPPPFMTAEEIARAEIEKRKRAEFVGRVMEKNPISLPEDFEVDLPG